MNPYIRNLYYFVSEHAEELFHKMLKDLGVENSQELTNDWFDYVYLDYYFQPDHLAIDVENFVFELHDERITDFVALAEFDVTEFEDLDDQEFEDAFVQELQNLL